MSENQAVVVAPVVLTKAEKITKIETQIKNLTQKLNDVVNDVVRTVVKKIAYLPKVGDQVLATIGRNTPTSQAKVVEATVVAVKLATIGADGKSTGATQVRISIGEGFEAQLVTVYPASLQPVAVEAEADAAEQGDYAQ